jgi:hypothetical protein
MLQGIKGLDNQHPIDVCLQGQANLDSYVAFLVLNGDNSNGRATIGKGYTFVANNQDTNAEQIIQAGTRYASLDREANRLIDMISEGATVSIYGFGVKIYDILISI